MRAFNKGNIKRDCALKIFISLNKVGLDLHISGEALKVVLSYCGCIDCPLNILFRACTDHMCSNYRCVLAYNLGCH